jgi:hypothetical protein
MFELKYGATYVIECDQCLSEKTKDIFLHRLHSKTEYLACRFILLDGGLKIVRELEDGESEEEGTREFDGCEHTESDLPLSTPLGNVKWPW